MAISVSTSVARVSADIRAQTLASPGSVVTAAFTPADNSLLVVCANCSGDGAGADTYAVTGGSLTWTERAHRDHSNNNNRGTASIWTAPVTTGASMTVTFTIATSAGSAYQRASVKVYIVTGQHASPIGASTTNTTTTNPTNAALTATGAGRLFGCAAEWNEVGTPTSSDTGDVGVYTGLVNVISAFKASDHVSGSQTINFNYGGAGPASNYALLEILAAGGSSQSQAPRSMHQFRQRFAQ
jgi:hypothetical protein